MKNKLYLVRFSHTDQYSFTYEVDNYLCLHRGTPNAGLWDRCYTNHHGDKVITGKETVYLKYNVREALPKAQANINSILGIP